MTRIPLRLTVLGSATPYPGPDRACFGYLVSGGGMRQSFVGPPDRELDHPDTRAARASSDGPTVA